MGIEANSFDISPPNKNAAVDRSYSYLDLENQQANTQQNHDQQQQNGIHQQVSKIKMDQRLTEEEVQQIRFFMRNNYRNQFQTPTSLSTALSMDTAAESVYAEFNGTTHAWTVFADDPAKRANKYDRILGTSIILFQIFTYYIFAKEAIRDYKSSSVPVEIPHRLCRGNYELAVENFVCEAMITDSYDNIIAFFMLGIFLSSDFLQAARAIRDASLGSISWYCALLAGFEVFCAFLAATIAISYNLHIGELTDAIEVGVGLLFIRELSTRAYAGLRYKGKGQYIQFFSVVFFVVMLGFILDPLYQKIFGTN